MCEITRDKVAVLAGNPFDRHQVFLQVSRGHKYIHAVVIDHPVRLVRLEKSQLQYTTELSIPVGSAINQFLRAGERLGVTKGAQSALHKLRGEV